MTRILVTGASGLLGLNLAMQAGERYEVVGQLHSRLLRAAPFATVQADLCQPDSAARLLDAVAPDWVLHCAALADLDACEQQPELAAELNTGAARRLAAAAQQRDMRFLHVSTDAVFDGQRGNYSEADEPNPLSVYAETKLDGEYAVMESHPHAIVARVNFFGWSVSGERSLAEFFFNHLSAGQPVKGLTDRYFSPLWVGHLAVLLLEMLEKEFKGLYHVSGSESLSKYEFGRRLAQRFGFDETLMQAARADELPYVAARAPQLTVDTSKLAKALGRPLPDVEAGLDGLYQQYQAGYPQQLRAMQTQPQAAAA